MSKDETKDLAATKEQLSSALSLIYNLMKGNGKIQNTALIEQYLPQIKDIASKICDIFGDGFQWADFLRFSTLIKPLMLLVAGVDGLDGDTKKEFVKEAFMLAYATYDKGTSGNDNNIKIPYLPAFVGQKIEDLVVPLIVDFAINTLFDELKETKQIK